ncbi:MULTISPECIES: metal ABC transporter solute-binding protein, Zn/Mn family [unclassified Rhodococcus (in: high G+C Gram-positive bacteria)]|uniref:metal ABC transporter solute-binding protein, Zn/Mn family n=1 Tax=unclassified Rhodococcus (in: high G+C Gram-positive bacteria) TaxID=192944 RepID=UPI0016394D37|nr:MULTISPECIES: zinc ABC transporter substrate-binding protein [unclassified Rhodococcus (in: high G+C Gram-positive bacteria)]MBC2644359.1 zinc ABC transporter substrate-binding protein [Rhodococcus sp. 3A]MBC2897949.1 zinc ABC transporter substrate-binding protein [Rhodococcus sp. 4CII]
MSWSRSFRVTTVAAGLSVAAALTLTACGSDQETDTAAGPVTVVASTNVWGSVAQAVAGNRAEVTSIITEPSSDPHSFEASPADAATISDASLVVYNGGGYDQFVDDILGSGNGNSDQRTVNAVDILEGGGQDRHESAAAPTGESPEGHEHGEINEHVWYDVAVVEATAHAIADQLGELDPDNAGAYRANADAFSGQLAQITAVTDSIAATHRDAPVAVTEPIAHYLLEEAALRDVTPEGFTSAIENGNDPAAADVAAVRQLFADKQVKALVYNVQTQDNVTEDVRATAEADGIPVVEVTETLPEGLDYLQWQTDTAKALAAALDRG